jgi:hypothetical protein
MKIEAINTQEDYEDFCDFIEKGKYEKLEINGSSIVIDDYKFMISKKFNFVIQDIIDFVTNTSTPKKDPPKEKVKKTKPVTKIEFIPTKIVTVSGISFSIF